MNLTKTLRFCAVMMAFAVLTTLGQANDAVPLIKTRTDTYKNVTLVSHNATHVFVQHSRGMATLKKVDLDKDVLIDLGVIADDRVKEPDGMATLWDEEGSSEDSEATATVGPGSAMAKLPPEVQDRIRSIPAFLKSVPRAFWIGLIVFLFCLVEFYCYCVKLICEKSGLKTGWWIWIPFGIIQKAALLRAARMSPYWVVIAIGLNVVDRYSSQIPPAVHLGVILTGLVLLLVLHVVWCVRIASARGKGALTILCLLVPITYPFAFLYLAFSGGEGEYQEDDVRPIRFEPLPA